MSITFSDQSAMRGVDRGASFEGLVQRARAHALLKSGRLSVDTATDDPTAHGGDGDGGGDGGGDRGGGGDVDGGGVRVGGGLKQRGDGADGANGADKAEGDDGDSPRWNGVLDGMLGHLTGRLCRGSRRVRILLLGDSHVWHFVVGQVNAEEPLTLNFNPNPRLALRHRQSRC